MSKRDDALLLIRYAGYHNDTAAFMRLYVENRISFTRANAEFQAGDQARRAGTPCNCSTCKAEQRPDLTKYRTATREQAINWLYHAGYNADRTEFHKVTLNIPEPIPFYLAVECFNTGVNRKAANAPCNCSACTAQAKEIQS